MTPEIAINIMRNKLFEEYKFCLTVIVFFFFIFGGVLVGLGRFSLIKDIEQSTDSLNCIPGSESRFRSNIDSPESYTNLSKSSTFNRANFHL